MRRYLVPFILVFLAAVSGFVVFWYFTPRGKEAYSPWIGFLAGAAVGFLVLWVERLIRRLPLSQLLGGAIGLLLGLGLAKLFSSFFQILDQGVISTFIYVMLALALGYLGLVVGGRRVRELRILEGLSYPFSYVSKRLPRKECPKVVDTSAIIDGRLADICETGWLDGPLLIPNFVLSELQHIADSRDPIRRGRGRRGLDVLNRIRESGRIEVRFIDQDYPKIREIDAKLVKLCRDLRAKLITTDFNLNKVARLKGVDVLNVNELAMALKPAVTPGEELRIQVLKEGKERDQGVGYLEDGTMVVVEGGRGLIGKEVSVVVSSVLQTPAGRIIFAQPKAEAKAA
ncbi:PIN/TRAM domain-containing protein [Thermosulfurimonas dismutans]|uniref:Pili retraction protein pilT n=1 Tax=Thermosulfurimonas dismutans TaxID=999894 RepID=A0A179D5E2_9BACT|nr:PIN domain-containing protein [Thermosulfurimonas dismutans]OAQ20939.1 Pili retraction protein pilT [Thermosulfurimonas dismutans]